jgi:2,4-dienoyl-CoA reductase (NADPH2)
VFYICLSAYLGEVSIPLCTTNRINSPETAEDIIASGHADMVSMARPFLADPHLVRKAMEGRADEINTCIGCNQACLDHIFENKKASCLVNPLAARETELVIEPVPKGLQQHVAVVGAGPAGLAFATTAAQRGHHVTLFDKSPEVGGQFNLAKKVPGKEEFFETIRYFRRRLEVLGVEVKLGQEVAARDLKTFDSVVVATGVTPRQVHIPVKEGTTKVKVYSYIDVLKGTAAVGKSVAVIGAGGIGYDVSDFLTHDAAHSAHSGKLPKGQVDAEAVKAFLDEWNIDSSISKGGLGAEKSKPQVPRKVFLLQRKAGKLGMGLGKTTGWIHRTTLKNRGTEELSGCKYLDISDEGLRIEQKGVARVLPVDTVVICAGQEPLRDIIYDPLLKNGRTKGVFLIGGAQEAGELDAKRAIDQVQQHCCLFVCTPSNYC